MDNTAAPGRTIENVIADISWLARTFLDERALYGALRTEIKKRMARTRLYIVNDLPECLENVDVIKQLQIARDKKTKLTLDSIDALVALEIGDDYDNYEAAKFNAATSEKAFQMFNSELSGYQSLVKQEVADKNTIDFAERFAGKTINHK